MPFECWLELLPQFIANLDCKDPIRRSVFEVISAVGRAHPQAVLLPLLVARQSADPVRSAAAAELLQGLRPSCPALLAQTEEVCHELNRVSSLWAEDWHTALQEASCFYFDDNNVPAAKEVITL